MRICMTPQVKLSAYLPYGSYGVYHRGENFPVLIDYGSFINYVDRILRFFDPPPPPTWTAFIDTEHGVAPSVAGHAN